MRLSPTFSEQSLAEASRILKGRWAECRGRGGGGRKIRRLRLNLLFSCFSAKIFGTNISQFALFFLSEFLNSPCTFFLKSHAEHTTSTSAKHSHFASKPTTTRTHTQPFALISPFHVSVRFVPLLHSVLLPWISLHCKLFTLINPLHFCGKAFELHMLLFNVPSLS